MLIRIHLGKTKVWNQAGLSDVLERLARIEDPTPQCGRLRPTLAKPILAKPDFGQKNLTDFGQPEFDQLLLADCGQFQCFNVD